MKQVLAKGAHSIAYIDTESPDVVVKENNNISKDRGYLRRQLAGYKIIKQVLDSGYETGVILPSLISTYESDDKQIVKERYIKGDTFDVEGAFYSQLSEEEKHIIAKQLAVFLVAMHSAGEMSAPEKSIKSMFDKTKLKSAQDILSVYKDDMPVALKKSVQNIENYLKSSDISDEVHVLTHRDLRSSNLMYDKDAKKLAVLDFELAGKDNVYRDFIASASASSMPWDFTKRVIREYNAISNKKYQITINPEKVQNMLIYAIVHEFARCVRPNEDQQIDDEEKKKYFNLIYSKIKNIAGIDIRQEVFNTATKDIKNKIPEIIKLQNKISENDDR